MTATKNRKLNKKDMLFARKDVAKIVLPLILQQLLTVAVGAIDTMMVASAGESAVSGVSLVNTLDILLMLFFTSLVSGGAVVVAQTLGNKQYEDARKASKQLLYIATAMALVVSIIAFVLRKFLLSLLFGEAEQSVMDSANAYFFFIIMSYPFVAIEGAIVALYRAGGNSIISLIVSLAMNLLNVGGNAFFIMVCGWGSAGAAISTLFVRVLGAGIMLVLFHRKKGELYIEKLFHYKPDVKIIKNVLSIGVPNGIESGMFHFGKLLTQSLISAMGTASIAANAVALTLSNFQYTVGTAFSNASITIVGRCIGAGESEQAKHYTKLLVGLNYLALWLVAGITLLLLEPIISLYALSSISAQITKDLVLYHSICAALIWPIAFTLASSFRAASDVKFPLVVSMLTMWIFRVAGSYVCALESVSLFGLFSIPGFALGVIGVWVAMTVDWLFRAGLFIIRYLSGVWLKKGLFYRETKLKNEE